MVAHDYSKSVYDCPACQRLRQITHEFSKAPSECPGCLEKAEGGYAAHATSNAAGASAHHASATHHRAPLAPTAASNGSHDLISVRARDAAREAVLQIRREQAARRKIAASWDVVIDDLNQNQSPPANTVS